MATGDPADNESVWGQYLAANGLPPDTPLPVSLDAHRALQRPDGLTHCRQCGGTLFTGTIVMNDRGLPVAVLKPQTCVGCGALRMAEFPPS